MDISDCEIVNDDTHNDWEGEGNIGIENKDKVDSLGSDGKILVLMMIFLDQLSPVVTIDIIF